ncbi:Coiled-coil protein [Giardia muris]|uniref:Coiled-coil protein n=1 Tax=Giardia muris TaxID=5742 RepID=A0A4Z1SNK5_GIAMU|nr:Coiled-coil protein [Giardia muris]|eukprot:TNJ27220.1 Coiled-coil protein [Giardia muris]
MADAELVQVDEKALAAYDLAIDEAAFAAIERDFHEVLAELVSDSSLDLFRTEYEKLHTALRKSHENEKMLVQRVRELAQQLSVNNQKIRTALRLSKEDQSTISALKAEIDKAWKIVDLAREKEGLQTEQIDKLRAEVQSLRGMIDTTAAGGNIGVPEEQNLEDLVRAKALLQQEYETRGKRIAVLREELDQHLDRIKQLESEKVSSELRVRALKEQVAQHRSEAARELQRREHLDRELASLRLKCENLEKDTLAKEQDIGQLKVEVQKAESKCEQEHGELQKTRLMMSSLQDKMQKLRADLADANRQSTNLQALNAEKEVLIQQHNQEAVQARAEAAKVQKSVAALQGRLDSLESQKRGAEEKVEQLRAQLASAEQELKAMRVANNELAREHEQVSREAQLVGKSLHVAQVSIADKDDVLKQLEGQAKNYEQELLSFRTESQKQRKIIFALEKEREAFSQKSTEAQQKYLQAVKEIRVRDLAISDLQKRVADTDGKLKQQQALYESVRSDRNLYSKSLVEAQDEVSELRRKFRVLSHVIDQLKSEILTKDESLLKEHFAHKSALKEKDAIVQDLERTRQQVRESEEAIAVQRAEIAKLNCIISEADMERDRQMKEYRIVISERDILGTQLIRRNDELSLLYERVRVQQATLAKGEKQYTDRIEDIRLLRAKITDLRRQIVSLRRQAASIEPYKRELFRLQRDLLDERAKTRALSQELQLPVNIHRWRSLEGSDPAAYELIKRVQYLQKRLIQKSEECSMKGLELEEKEKLYNDLKKVLSRQPGSEVLEKLSAYQDALKGKTRQLQTLSSELAMYQAQSSEYKETIERLTRELQDLKRKYFAFKKKEYEQMVRDGAAAATATVSGFRPANAEQPKSKMVGGGFSVTYDGRGTVEGVS